MTNDETSFNGPRTLPLLPLREVVIFPHAPISLIVGRERSIAAVDAAQSGDKAIFLSAQRTSEDSDPTADDVETRGTIATIEHLLRLPDGNVKVLFEGRRRARIVASVAHDRMGQVRVEPCIEHVSREDEISALVRSVKDQFERFVRHNRAIPPEMLAAVKKIDDPSRLADTLVGPLQLKLPERQALLENLDITARLERILTCLGTEIEFLQVDRKLKRRARREREHSQRDAWLKDQVKSMQNDASDKEDKNDLEEIAAALKEKDLPPHARARSEKELKRLSQMNLMSAEATVIRNYLDWVLALPWNVASDEQPSLEQAAQILDDEHYGLQPIKERIVEQLAIAKLVTTQRGPILCLVGPPGVGKTSLARSIANAAKRPFVKIALGGVRDEAEIRGHRRTYIGAMPGKLIQAMKRADASDPILLLDEIDKMTSDFRGDPSSALLEVLDHEQNTTFNDHYLDMDYDLSKATFICTANDLQGIPLPLQDRLETIELSGYTEPEKIAIARKYLLPRQLGLHGIQQENVDLSDAALTEIIRHHTKESGVRGLERKVARVCRKVARRVVDEGTDLRVVVDVEQLVDLLGPPKHRIGTRESEDQVGLVKGLAVSPWGGELLNIEVAAVRGKGELKLTGRLGDWLKESGNAALTYIRSRADAFDIDAEFHQNTDLHIHYPGNPLRTDGPSAGIAMATAMVSALTGLAVRADTAMTGEVSLRGNVFKIGGLKEKVLAAHRGGITRIIIPEANERDLEEIPRSILDDLQIHPVRHMDSVLRHALNGTSKATHPTDEDDDDDDRNRSHRVSDA